MTRTAPPAARPVARLLSGAVRWIETGSGAAAPATGGFAGRAAAREADRDRYLRENRGAARGPSPEAS